MALFPQRPIYVCGPARTYGEYDAGALSSPDMAMSVVMRERALPLEYASAGGAAAVGVARERVGAQGRDGEARVARMHRGERQATAAASSLRLTRDGSAVKRARR